MNYPLPTFRFHGWRECWKAPLSDSICALVLFLMYLEKKGKWTFSFFLVFFAYILNAKEPWGEFIFLLRVSVLVSKADELRSKRSKTDAGSVSGKPSAHRDMWALPVNAGSSLHVATSLVFVLPAQWTACWCVPPTATKATASENTAHLTVNTAGNM